ncbi:class I SAM-dependent methyltransferase [Streptomyces sp. NPDC046237]|uniref:class I SAM-dependent methyltransferase n=1 Tax=Streptomyces sp. NPDC046237 TaxID=3154914 RepID=UPI0033D45DB7
MRPLVNTAQSEAWNGYEGRHWSDHHDRWKAVNEGFDAPLLAAAAIRPEDRVLDIGCGTGQTTRLAARAAHRGAVLGLDLSEPMLDRARELAAEEGPAGIDFRCGDAQVHPLPAAAFDVAVSRFGVMFFQDPSAAFANVGSALRPGGRIAFTCMADPSRTDWVRVLGVLGDLVPPTAPAGASGTASGASRTATGASGTASTGASGDVPAPGMFSLADPGRIRRVLTSAGFEAVSVVPCEADGLWGRDAEDAAAFVLDSGPARHFLAPLGPDSAERARAEVVRSLREFERPRGVLLRTAAWLVTATRP